MITGSFPSFKYPSVVKVKLKSPAAKVKELEKDNASLKEKIRELEGKIESMNKIFLS